MSFLTNFSAFICYYVVEVVLVDKTMLDLYLKFKEIKKMGYIKSYNKRSNSAGVTFEKLLGKKQDELFWPVI